MAITKIPKLGKAVSAWFRNRASKKLFKEASGGMQHPVIKSVKPKPTKGESTKVWGDKLSRSFKKKLDDSTEGMDKVLISANKILQKVKGEKITKSGISKGKDIKK
jgi:hypothetical protein|tara:strand:- start:146 stop:463 length:318 start_codon:yes stop_codon:yes gene_type:complete